MNKLTQGNGNLIRQASSFVDLGVKVKKTMPRILLNRLGSRLMTAARINPGFNDLTWLFRAMRCMEHRT